MGMERAPATLGRVMTYPKPYPNPPTAAKRIQDCYAQCPLFYIFFVFIPNKIYLNIGINRMISQNIIVIPNAKINNNI